MPTLALDKAQMAIEQKTASGESAGDARQPLCAEPYNKVHMAKDKLGPYHQVALKIVANHGAQLLCGIPFAHMAPASLGAARDGRRKECECGGGGT